jgi:hypothetical protein
LAEAHGVINKPKAKAERIALLEATYHIASLATSVSFILAGSWTISQLTRRCDGPAFDDADVTRSPQLLQARHLRRRIPAHLAPQNSAKRLTAPNGCVAHRPILIFSCPATWLNR